MAGTGPGDAHDLAVEVLAAAVEALDSIPVFEPAFVGAPARTFVSPGKPAHDCCDDGQLTVHIQPVSEGASAPRVPRASQARINRVALNIISLRCIQTDPKGPDPDQAEEVAAQINRDGWAIWNHLWNLQREGLLFNQCGDVIWGQLTSIPAQGTCGGWSLTITASLDGYEETIGT